MIAPVAARSLATRLSTALLALTCPAVTQAKSAVLIATPATFLAQVKAAQPGDTVQLARGVYTNIPVRAIAKASPGVTIDASAATFSNIGFYGASGFTWQGGACAPPSGVPKFYTCMLIQQGSSNITVKDGVWQGATAAAIGVGGSTHITITGNVFHVLTDGVDVSGSQFVDIERNQCLVASPSAGHADCVQVWNIAGYPISSDITVAWNSAIGYLQGYDNFGSPAALQGTLRAHVHDNAYAGMGTAGLFSDCTGCTMTGNVAFGLNVTPKGVNIRWGVTAPASTRADDQPVTNGNVDGKKN